MQHSLRIPFEGFYESIHDARFDSAVQDFFRDYERGDELPIPDDVWHDMPWQKLQNEYARRYLELFQDALNESLETNITLTFEEMTSPREYNFETDKIFATISTSDLYSLILAVDNNLIGQAIRDLFTSYDGFMSFYSNTLHDDEWQQPINELDFNHLYAVMRAAYDDDTRDELIENLWEDSEWLDNRVSDELYDLGYEVPEAAVN